MRLLSVEIQDILSIQNASMSFEDVGLVLIEGWNYDTNRANGAGKSAIFNCIAFGLYDKLPRKITASEILRRGCKSGFVKCSVLCGEDVWTVHRSRPKGVRFFKNDVEQNISQEEFESFIRLTYQQFLLTIYTPQANSGSLSRFLAAPDASKKSFLLELLNLNQFGSAKKAADKTIESIQAQINLDTNSIANLRSKIEIYQESLVDPEDLEKSIAELNSALIPLEEEVKTNSVVSKPDLSKYSKVEDDVRQKQNEIAQAKAKRSMLHDKYRELSAAVQEYDSNNACSECGASLDTPEARDVHAQHQDKVKSKILDIKSQIDQVDAIVLKENNVNDIAKKLRDKKQQESAAFQTAQLRISELKSLIKTKNIQLENLQAKLNTSSDLLGKISILESNVAKNLEKLNESRKQLELYKTLSTIYSPTGAQAYVLDSVVDSFNEVIQKYIDIMSPNITYTLNSFKETSKGEVVAKFSETLTKSGNVVSVGSLSGGEEKGLSLCVDFALLEVLETQFGMTLNPIILDEPFDGLDTAGREIVIDLLDTLARSRQIFVVDHSSEGKSMFSKILKIELRNEVSSIV